MRKRAIKNIWIMTLEATPNRKWGCLGALDARLFPMDQVHAVHGVDGLTYNSHDEIVRAAAADGFSFFTENPDYLKRPIPMVAGTWSACRVLRKVAEQNDAAIVMEDDWVFTIDYPEILKRLELLDADKTDIAALIAKLYTRGRLRCEVQAVDPYWIAGIPVSAACASVYTPKGAALVLKRFAEHRGTTLEKAVMGIKYPTAVTMLQPVGHHPLLMGPSRANPDGTRESYVNAYARWEQGVTL